MNHEAVFRITLITFMILSDSILSDLDCLYQYPLVPQKSLMAWVIGSGHDGQHDGQEWRLLRSSGCFETKRIRANSQKI